MMKLVAGVDIGGTNTVFGLISKEGEILFKDSVKTTDFPNPTDLVAVVANQLNIQLTTQFSNAQLLGIGIGAPNGNFFTGNIEFAPNLLWKGIVPLAQLFAEALHTKALLTNDANAATLGELIFGGAKNLDDFLFVTLGTGLGSGFVSNGKLIYGHDGLAGELGHVILIPDGRTCGCGRKGCVETYCSATGLRRTFAELSKIPFSIEIPSSKEIYDLAQRGNEIAQEAFDKTAQWLGLTLANSVAISSPKTIFLFGGLANAGDYLLTPTKKYFESNVLNIYKNKVTLQFSELPEENAALLGAASLIFNEYD
jgi:glucokinase